MSAKPQYGPYHRYEGISTFPSISENAFKLFDKSIEKHFDQLGRPVHHLFFLFFYLNVPSDFDRAICVCYNYQAK